MPEKVEGWARIDGWNEPVANLLHSAKIVAVAFAKSQDGAPGAKHSFPEMGELLSGGVSVNVDCFGNRTSGLTVGIRGIRSEQ